MLAKLADDYSVNWRQQAKPLIDRRLSAIVGITPEKRPRVQGLVVPGLPELPGRVSKMAARCGERKRACSRSRAWKERTSGLKPRHFFCFFGTTKAAAEKGPFWATRGTKASLRG
jgi:hypothetical protein